MMKRSKKIITIALSGLFLCTQATSAESNKNKKKVTDETDFQLIFLLNDEYYGTDIADEAVLAVNPEKGAKGLENASSKMPQLAVELGSPKKLQYLISENRLPKKVLASLDADDPERLLHQYVVATYDVPSDVEEVYSIASEHVKEEKEKHNNGKGNKANWNKSDLPFKFVEKNMKLEYSSIPNDTYFYRPVRNQYFSFAKLNIPNAWNYTTGRVRLGLIDSGIDENHPEFRHYSKKFNYMKRYSMSITRAGHVIYGKADESNLSNYGVSSRGHGTHVAGIMAAATNNRKGVAGVCQECTLSVVAGAYQRLYISNAAIGIKHNIDTGAVAINMSFGTVRPNYCGDNPSSSICQAIGLAQKNNVQLIAASGNGDYDRTISSEGIVPDSPDNLDFPASDSRVISVGAIDNSGNRMNSASSWYTQMGSGSNKVDVMAPGVNIFSTFYRNGTWSPSYGNGYSCDEKFYGYGYCTGTSMSTPFITGIVGLMRSANPYLTNSQVKYYLTKRGNYTSKRDDGFTYKIPNAYAIVRDILSHDRDNYAKNSKVPLITLYSSQLGDHFYTTSPQNAATASYTVSNGGSYSPYYLKGNAAPNYFNIYGYKSRPYATRARGNAYIFTTEHNPVNSSSRCKLAPLYRLNYWESSRNADHVYTTEQSGINTLTSWGYKYEGIEGYIFPKNCPRPSGAVKLMRKYNRSRDDHAIFPETIYSTMYNQGYRENSGSDWLGYVYPM